MFKLTVIIGFAFIVASSAVSVDKDGFVLKLKHTLFPLKHTRKLALPIEHREIIKPVREFPQELPIEHQTPIKIDHVGHEDYHDYPKYNFEYGVKDYHTGDHKSHWEIRDGDVVTGEYTIDEADGTKRVVSYHASDKTGFKAVVRKVGKAVHPIYHHHY